MQINNIKQSIIKIINIAQNDFSKLVNMHIHTACSDGKFTPEEVINKAKQLNYKYISITDHNTMEAYTKIKMNDSDITIIPGVELESWYKGVKLHILVFLDNPNNKKILDLCKKIEQQKNNLSKSFIIKIGNFVQTHIVKHKFVSQIACLGADYLQPNKVTTKEILKTVNEENGIAVLAHPAVYWTTNIARMIGSLKRNGLKGVEVYYPYKKLKEKNVIILFNSPAKIKRLAEKFELLLTGGTDCHSRDLNNPF